MKQIITADQLTKFYGTSLGTKPVEETTTVVETTQPKKGFLSAVKEAFTSRVGKAQEAQQKAIEGKQNIGSATLQTIGQGAGFVGDVAGEAIMGAGKTLLPKAAEQKIAQTASSIFGSKPVQTVVSEYEQFKQKYPEAAGNLESIVNIASLLPVGGGAKVGTKLAGEVGGEIAQKAGTAIAKGADEAIIANKLSFANKLIEPIETAKTRLEQVSRTKEIGGTKIVEPTAQQVRQAQLISTIEGVSPKNTFQSNFRAIDDEIIKRANELETNIASNDFLIPKKETLARLNQAKMTLAESPVLVGDAQKTAEKLIAGAEKFINENKGSASGLLQARKDYDNWVISQRPKAFDAKADNAFTIANREVRNTLNTLLDEKAPNVGVKESLRNQSELFRARDIVEDKAANEAKTRVGRALEKIGEKIGAKNKAVQTAAGLGLVSAPIVAASFALPLTLIGGTGYLTYRAGKFIVSPEVRKTIGNALKKAGNKITDADKKILEKLVK